MDRNDLCLFFGLRLSLFYFPAFPIVKANRNTYVFADNSFHFLEHFLERTSKSKAESIVISRKAHLIWNSCPLEEFAELTFGATNMKYYLK